MLSLQQGPAAMETSGMCHSLARLSRPSRAGDRGHTQGQGCPSAPPDPSPAAPQRAEPSRAHQKYLCDSRCCISHPPGINAELMQISLQ